MLSRQGILKIFSLLLILSLFVVACERPLQGVGDDGEETPTASVDEGGAAPTEEGQGAEISGEATPDAGAVGAQEPTAEPQETPTEPVEEVAPTEEGAEAEDESPRAGDEPSAEEEGMAGETADEATATEEEAAEEGAEEEAPAEEAQETTEEEAAASEDGQAGAGQEATEVRTHVVQAGENLYRIGLQYGISWVVLAQYNNLPNANAIYAGQELRIPPSEEAAQETPTPTPAPAPETTYVVQPGDNLYRIGLMFDVSWVEIADANGIVNPNRIVVGQELTIPTETPEPSPQVTHTVERGETLFTISLRYGVPWTDIAEENDLASPYVIYPGQTLVIPGG